MHLHRCFAVPAGRTSGRAWGVLAGRPDLVVGVVLERVRVVRLDARVVLVGS
ncbi:hypothetical protein [Yimella sp. RIT 621]|uniref:hypothetical protein n=1 Tax=Yimella sp. RIT 621 TaxID=2510323 RepID=UPI001459FBEC|nr:hypothetical protein [Yimella sp. RIT 621]